MALPASPKPNSSAMDDTEVDALFGHPQNQTIHLPNDSMEDLIHELLTETDHPHGCCTHVHTCNYPQGPDNSHTHTCFHVHTNTKLITPAADAETNDDNDDDSGASESTETKSCKRPVKRKKGNREAVRKYREKKKARTASLEDEISRLRGVNQHLLQRLKGNVALEAEVARLKCLFVDLRARIQGEISSFFPYQPSCTLDVADPCDAPVHCAGHDIYNAHPNHQEKH